MTPVLPKFVSSKIFEGKVTISEPIALLKAKKFAQNDAKSMVGWPKDLSKEVVSHNLRCIYLAHWVVSGEGSGQWSALAGGQSKRSVSGVARDAISGKVIENYAKSYEDEEKFPLLGKRDFKARETLVDPNKHQEVDVIKPVGSTFEAGRKIAESAVESAVWSDGYDVAKKADSEGSVDKYRLGYLSYSNISFRTWLYPVYVGTYSYKDREYGVKVDGITGQTTIDKPASLVNNLLEGGSVLLLIIVFIVGIAGLFNGESEICFGALGVLAVFGVIAFAIEKFQEWDKSFKRK